MIGKIIIVQEGVPIPEGTPITSKFRVPQKMRHKEKNILTESMSFFHLDTLDKGYDVHLLSKQGYIILSEAKKEYELEGDSKPVGNELEILLRKGWIKWKPYKAKPN